MSFKMTNVVFFIYITKLDMKRCWKLDLFWNEFIIATLYYSLVIFMKFHVEFNEGTQDIIADTIYENQLKQIKNQ